MRILIASIFTLFLILSVSVYEANSKVGIEIKHDTFTETSFYETPCIEIKKDLISIRAIKKFNSAHVDYQVCIKDQYPIGERNRYIRAYSHKGKRLKTKEIEERQKGEIYNEIIISINKRYLEKGLKKGVKIKLYGKEVGAKKVFIPGEYIKNFLKKMESTKTTLRHNQ